MKVSAILLTAMAARGVKDAVALHELTGIPYDTVRRALNDKNVGVFVVVELLDYMGYQLKAEIK